MRSRVKFLAETMKKRHLSWIFSTLGFVVALLSQPQLQTSLSRLHFVPSVRNFASGWQSKGSDFVRPQIRLLKFLHAHRVQAAGLCPLSPSSRFSDYSGLHSLPFRFRLRKQSCTQIVRATYGFAHFVQLHPSLIIASQKQVVHFAIASIHFCFCYFEFRYRSLYAKSAPENPPLSEFHFAQYVRKSART